MKHSRQVLVWSWIKMGAVSSNLEMIVQCICYTESNSCTKTILVFQNQSEIISRCSVERLSHFTLFATFHLKLRISISPINKTVWRRASNWAQMFPILLHHTSLKHRQTLRHNWCDPKFSAKRLHRFGFSSQHPIFWSRPMNEGRFTANKTFKRRRFAASGAPFDRDTMSTIVFLVSSSELQNFLRST